MEQKTKIYVGNLSFKTDEAALEAAFAGFGNVVDSKLITDRETGRSRGFGFVTFDTAESANKAVEAMNGKEIDGRALRVNIAEDRPKTGGNGGRGERGNGGGFKRRDRD